VGQDAYVKRDYQYLWKYKKNNLEKWLGYSFMLLPQINTIAKFKLAFQQQADKLDD